uniref:Uncharacterized protein n=1 Tax=Arundo donax TaxID=35708 RepID=A0A0A9E4M2_ARUDO
MFMQSHPRLHKVAFSIVQSRISSSNHRYEKHGVCQARIQDVHGYQSARLVPGRRWWQPVWRATAAGVGTRAHIPIFVAPTATISASRP